MPHVLVHGDPKLRASLERALNSPAIKVLAFAETGSTPETVVHIAQKAENIPSAIRKSAAICVAYESEAACSDTLICGGDFPQIPESLLCLLKNLSKDQEREIPYEKIQTLFDEVVSIAHHDFSEPARNIAFFAELLTKGGLSSDREADFLSRTTIASQRLQALIRDLTRYARVWLRPAESDDLNAAEIQTIVEESYERALLRGSIEKRALFEIEITTTLKIPSRFLGRIAEELIANGIEHHESNDEPLRFVVGPSKEAEMSRLEVIDTGPGITIPSGVSLFRPFYRNERNDELRTGIGLAMVKALCERAGGSVELVGEPNSPKARLCLLIPT